MNKVSNKEAVENARHSLELEGFVFTEEENKLFEDLANNKISDQDVLNFADEKIAKLKITNPEYFDKV